MGIYNMEALKLAHFTGQCHSKTLRKSEFIVTNHKEPIQIAETTLTYVDGNYCWICFGQKMVHYILVVCGSLELSSATVSRIDDEKKKKRNIK